MNGKRKLGWLLPAAFALFAFGGPPAPVTDRNAEAVFQYRMTVQEDGSAEFSHILKITPELVEEIVSDGKTAEDEICRKTFSDLESTLFSFTQEEHGEEIWCTHSTSFDDLDRLADSLEHDFQSLTIRRLEIEEDVFSLDLSWSQFPCTSNDPSKFTCEWVVEAPGEVGENNATRVKGNTLTWDMTDSDVPKRFTAESAVGGFDPTLLIAVSILLCGCCTVTMLIGCGVAVFFFLRRRGSEAAASSPDARELPPSPADTIIL